VALHLIPADDGQHKPAVDCQCQPEPVEVETTDGRTRWAWLHRGDGDGADGVEIAALAAI